MAAQTDLDAIVKDVAELKKDIGKLLEHAKTRAAETVNGETQRLYGTLLSEGEKSAAAFAQQIEEKPFASILIAFTLGFVGGNLLRR